jgi:hypothetical protein
LSAATGSGYQRSAPHTVRSSRKVGSFQGPDASQCGKLCRVTYRYNAYAAGKTREELEKAARAEAEEHFGRSRVNETEECPAHGLTSFGFAPAAIISDT